ncbi:unnamed protein product, partial [marine sediment metagenome]
MRVTRDQRRRQFLASGERHAGARSGAALTVLFCFGACLLLSACASPDGTKSKKGPEFVLIPAPPEQPRIQFLKSYNKDLDVLPPLNNF